MLDAGTEPVGKPRAPASLGMGMEADRDPQNEPWLHHIDAGLAKYKSREGKELCREFQRKVYGVRLSYLGRPECNPSCQLAHVRLPEGFMASPSLPGGKRGWSRRMVPVEDAIERK